MPRGARITTSVVIRSNRIPALVVQIQDKSKQAVLDAAHVVQQRAQQLSAVDTGSMRASIYVSAEDESDYVQAASTARSLNHDAVILDEIDPEFVISPSGGASPQTTAIVGVAVGHGIFNEYGTVHQRAQPFLIPSAMAAQDSFTEQMTHIAD